MKIVLDTSVLVRANEHSHGLARDLLIRIVEDRHALSEWRTIRSGRITRYTEEMPRKADLVLAPGEGA